MFEIFSLIPFMITPWCSLKGSIVIVGTLVLLDLRTCGSKVKVLMIGRTISGRTLKSGQEVILLLENSKL